MRHETPFTYRSTLKIHHVQESDAVSYMCTGKYTNTNTQTNEMNHGVLEALSDYATYNLNVHGNCNDHINFSICLTCYLKEYHKILIVVIV